MAYPERRDRERSRGFLNRIAGALFGRRRTPVGARRRRPIRALPLLAVGILGAAVVELGTPEPEVVNLPAIEVKMRPLGGGQLPLEVNERVAKWIYRFMTTDRVTFETFLSRESIFSTIIEGKLAERGMPEDLLYMAMIESGFSTRATSPVGAGGVWQFMAPTAEQYGLRVDPWVDERRDPVKATDAALDYLEWLYDRYDSWYLAAAAYNAGPGRVDEALESHASDKKGDQDIYWEIIERLPRETRDYVPKVLAAVALARDAERYGFEVSPERAYEFERIWVPGGTSLATVAADVGIAVSRLKDLNPHLVRGVTPPGTSYALRIPIGSVEDVMAALGSSSAND
jgi:membrane-bound lytic murein transglycosylase D